MKIIKFASKDNKKHFLLNPAYIAEVVPLGEDGCVIISHAGREYKVGGTIDDIKGIIDEHFRDTDE